MHWRSQRAALVVALLVILVWGTNFSIFKAVMTRVSPEALLFARYLVTPACAVVLLVFLYGARWPAVPRSEWAAIAWLVLVGHLLHVSLMAHGMAMSTPFSSALISACGPLFSLIIVAAIGSERLGRAQLAGVAIAFVGVLIFLADKLAAGRWSQGAGDLVMVAAIVAFSIHTVIARQLSQRLSVIVMMAYTTLLGSIPMLVINGRAGLAAPWSLLSPALWAALAWGLVVASFTGWLVWAWVNSVRGVARSAPLLYLLPPVAGAAAWAALGETFSWLKLFGAAVALAGVAIAQFAGGTHGRKIRVANSASRSSNEQH
jgi:drug/metabolite transporter (DMT)-like permease